MDDSGRRPSAVWTWRSTVVVLSLALVSSLAVGLGAAGGLSVLDEPGPVPPEVPPLADSRPSVPLPLDAEPPPVPNTADVAEPEAPRDSEPEVVPVAEPERVPLPETGEVESEVDDTVEGTWTTVDETVEGTWGLVDGTVGSVPVPQLFGGDEKHCPRSEAFRPSVWDAEPPSWDTGGLGWGDDA